MIELKQVSKVYPGKDGDIVAVKDVNLSIANGEIFGVIGYSGAGKSSLIRLLNKLEEPSGGQILIDGIDIAQAHGKELRQARQSIGMVFQHFNLLWSRTVAENISFPLEIAGIDKQQRQQRVAELVELVGLQGRENAYPSQLSGGQKQRVGIARALANRPKLLLCDEATSALDPKTTDSILELLLDINRRLNLTVVLITHEMHVVKKICDRVAVIDKGQIVEQGTVIEVFHKPQQEITKRFVKQLTEFEDEGITEEMLQSVTKGALLKLSFAGANTLEPFIATVVREFDINVSILQGRVTHVVKDVIGYLYVYAQTNSTEQTQQLVDFLIQREVNVEVIKHV